VKIVIVENKVKKNKNNTLTSTNIDLLQYEKIIKKGKGQIRKQNQ
jgi:hypothetical protein